MQGLTDAVVQFCKLEINIIVHEGHPVKEEQEQEQLYFLCIKLSREFNSEE